MSRWCAIVLSLACGSGLVYGQDLPPAPKLQAPADDAVLPHINVDRAARLVDLDATVIGGHTDWLELLACTPKSREHEAILTVPARPSHVHLALLMIGLEPGGPMSWRMEGEKIVTTPSHGPRVEVSIVLDTAGKETEVPAAQWIVNKHSGEPMADSVWLFTGSKIQEINGTTVYVADIDGAVLSLVNFGNDVLVKPTDKTNMNDEEAWGVRAEAIPPAGTKVKIRLRPAKD